uniref:dTMP kinase n=1 Tax=Trichuris muris TaxID=70415 RepID=A0A5S6Q625_TRIMR
MKKEERGIFVVLEGLDCSGKTTQALLLKEKLEELKLPAEFFRFPTRTGPIGRALHDYLRFGGGVDDHALHLLFSADRWTKAREIEDLLKTGIHVVADRYAHSGFAYSVAKGLDFDWCVQPDKGLPRPDLVLFLDARPENLMLRRNSDQEVFETPEFQAQVYNVYRDNLQDTSWRSIDATQDESIVHQDIVGYFLLNAQDKAITQSPISYF